MHRHENAKRVSAAQTNGSCTLGTKPRQLYPAEYRRINSSYVQHRGDRTAVGHCGRPPDPLWAKRDGGTREFSTPRQTNARDNNTSTYFRKAARRCTTFTGVNARRKLVTCHAQAAIGSKYSEIRSAIHSCFQVGPSPRNNSSPPKVLQTSLDQEQPLRPERSYIPPGTAGDKHRLSRSSLQANCMKPSLLLPTWHLA